MSYPTATYCNPNEFAAICLAFVQSVRSAIGPRWSNCQSVAPGISAGPVAFVTSATLLIRLCDGVTLGVEIGAMPQCRRASRASSSSSRGHA